MLTVGDNSCLEGGGILGRYCKNGGGGSRSVATGSGFSGINKAGDAEASLILDFQNGQEVRVTMAEARGTQESVDATYETAFPHYPASS